MHETTVTQCEPWSSSLLSFLRDNSVLSQWVLHPFTN